jgi:TRAP transporter TAXI family solute receptor
MHIWLGGNPGDGWYEMVQRWIGALDVAGIAHELQLEAGGGEANLTALASGHGTLGLSIDVVASAAYNGAAPFTEPLRNLACLGTGWSALPYNLLGARDATFESRLASRTIRVGAPPTDTTDELMFRHVLTHYGISYDDIWAAGGKVLLAGYHDLVAALHAGEIDFVFGATTMPAPSIAHATSGPRDITLLSLPRDVVGYLENRHSCRPGIIPAATYPGLQNGPVETCFVDTVIVVPAALDVQTAQKLTSLLLGQFEHITEIHPSLGDFNPYTAWRSVPVPLHLGAANAYREAGYLS